MTKPKNKLLIVLALIVLIVVAANFIYSVSLNDFNVASVVECALEIAICITAFIYIIHEFSKDYAVDYKLYFILDAASYVIAYICFAFDTEAPENFTQVMIGVAVEFVCFGAYVLLAFAPDFGRKKSLITVWIPVILYALCAAYYAIAYLTDSTSESFLYLVWEYITYIPACLLPVILVYGKYADKALRKGADADK